MSIKWLMALCMVLSITTYTYEAYSLDPQGANTSEDSDVNEAQDLDLSTDSDTVMCELSKKYLTDIKVECLGQFQHYQSLTTVPNGTSAAIKIGQWNVFNLGMDKQRFKDLDLLADLVAKQQWDVFAATEIFPLSGTALGENKRLADYLDSLIRKNATSSDIADVKKQFQWHGAVRLLRALQRKDPSWSLILAPKSLGSEGSSALETGGVYYRANSVKPIVNEHCGTIGCLIELPTKLYPGMTADMLSEVVSREPFMASFVTHDGTFDFTILPFHARFRHPKKNGIMEAITGAKIASDGTVTFGNGLFFDIESILGRTKADEFRKKLAQEIQDRLSGKLKGAEKKDTTKEQLARYAELAALGRFMKHLKSTYKEQDVIWTGDFNLEYDLDPNIDTLAEQKLRGDWDSVLLKNPSGWPGAVVLVNEPTSLSDKERLKSNYDHFVLDPLSTNECSAKTAKAIDFTVRSNAPMMERYTVLLNEIPFGEDYDRVPLLSVVDLVTLAQTNAIEFNALTEEQRLGLSDTQARALGQLRVSDRKAYDKRKQELEELMLDLNRRRMEAYLNQPWGYAERQKIQKRVSEQALGLQNLWGVYEDTINGQKVLSYQLKYPQDSASEISPERTKRAAEYDKIVADYVRRLFDSQWTIDPRTAKDVRYQVYREVISDHLPIDISCELPPKDDD